MFEQKWINNHLRTFRILPTRKKIQWNFIILTNPCTGWKTREWRWRDSEMNNCNQNETLLSLKYTKRLNHNKKQMPCNIELNTISIEDGICAFCGGLTHWVLLKPILWFAPLVSKNYSNWSSADLKTAIRDRHPMVFLLGPDFYFPIFRHLIAPFSCKLNKIPYFLTAF